MEITAIILIVLAALVSLAIFLRGRARAGIRPFEITESDEAAFREARRAFGIRRLLGRLLGTLGALLVVVGISWPLFSDASAKPDWRTAGFVAALGFILVLSAVSLVRQARRG